VEQVTDRAGSATSSSINALAVTTDQTIEPTTAQASILRACGLASTSRITTLDPA
jgi:hypothetical protein